MTDTDSDGLVQVRQKIAKVESELEGLDQASEGWLLLQQRLTALEAKELLLMQEAQASRLAAAAAGASSAAPPPAVEPPQPAAGPSHPPPPAVIMSADLYSPPGFIAPSHGGTAQDLVPDEAINPNGIKSYVDEVPDEYATGLFRDFYFFSGAR